MIVRPVEPPVQIMIVITCPYLKVVTFFINFHFLRWPTDTFIIPNHSQGVFETQFQLSDSQKPALFCRLMYCSLGYSFCAFLLPCTHGHVWLIEPLLRQTNNDIPSTSTVYHNLLTPPWFLNAILDKHLAPVLYSIPTHRAFGFNALALLV